MTPDDRKYAKTHEWIKVDGPVAVIGITDHAQHALGDITFIELPEKGSSIDKDAECGVVESVKAASDIYAPTAGEISEVNKELENSPELVNQDPYGKGWILKLKNFDAAGLNELMDAAEYEASLDQNA